MVIPLMGKIEVCGSQIISKNKNYKKDFKGENQKEGGKVSKGEDRKFEGKEEKEKRGGKTWLFMLVRAGCPIVLYSRGISVMLGDY